LSGALSARFWQPQSAVLGGAHSRGCSLSVCAMMDLPLDLPEERSWSGCVAASQVFIQRAGRRPCDGTALSIKRAIAASPPTSLVGRAANPGLGLVVNRFSGSMQRVIAASRAVCALCGAHGGRGDMFRPLVPSSVGEGACFAPWCRVLAGKGVCFAPGAEFWWSRGHVSPLVPSSVG